MATVEDDWRWATAAIGGGSHLEARRDHGRILIQLEGQVDLVHLIGRGLVVLAVDGGGCGRHLEIDVVQTCLGRLCLTITMIGPLINVFLPVYISMPHSNDANYMAKRVFPDVFAEISQYAQLVRSGTEGVLGKVHEAWHVHRALQSEACCQHPDGYG